MANNPNVAALAAWAGKYERDLMRKFFNEFDASKDLQFLKNVKSKMRMTKLSVNDQSRPYTGVFTPIEGDIAFSNVELVVDKAQRDILIDPEQYRGTFMEDMRGAGEGTSNKNIPFAQFTWETVLGQNAADINDRTVFFGRGKAAYAAYAAGTAYSVGALIYFNNGVRTDYYKCVTATTAGQSPSTHPAKWVINNSEAITEGFGQKIKDLITAGKLTPVSTGVVSASSGAYDQFTALWRSLPVAIRNRGGVIYCSFDDADLLADDFENKVTKYTETDQATGKMYLSKTGRKCEIKPVTWMSGTRRLIATVSNNLVLGTDLLDDMMGISVVPSHYTLEASLSFVFGTQIRDAEWMRVSDQV